MSAPPGSSGPSLSKFLIWYVFALMGQPQIPALVHLGIGNEFLAKIIGAKARKVPSTELVLSKETECSKNVP